MMMLEHHDHPPIILERPTNQRTNDQIATDELLSGHGLFIHSLFKEENEPYERIIRSS